MEFDGFDAVHLFLTKQTRDQVVNRTHRNHAHPPQSARVNVADCPIRVVRQGIDGLDGHHGAFKGGHPIKGQRHDQEAQNRVIAQFVPSARQGHDAVDHAAPTGCQQDQREHHPNRLRPVR